MPNGHAKLAPSSAYRWLFCHGSIALSAESVGPEGSSTVYADEGTAGHEVFARVLNGEDLASFLGKRIAVEGNPEGVEITQELLDHVADAIEWVKEYREKHPKAAIFSEHAYEIGAGFELPIGLMWGTADLSALSVDELCIADLKLGFVDVAVEENTQAILYALGALDAVGWIFDRVRLAILQPRSGGMKEHVYTAAEMQAFRDKFRPDVLAVAEGDRSLRSSEEACRFCPAAGVCPELRKETLALAKREFSSLVTLSGDEIADLLFKGEMIENAMKSVRSHAIRLLELDPDAIPGWKRVLGEKKRKWKDEEEAQKRFEKDLDLDVIAPRKLVSPLQVEKALAEKFVEESGRKTVRGIKKECKEKADKVIEKYAHKPEGDPTLVRAVDARPALGPVFTEAEVASIAAASEPMGPDSFGGSDEGSHYMNTKQGHGEKDDLID